MTIYTTSCMSNYIIIIKFFLKLCLTHMPITHIPQSKHNINILLRFILFPTFFTYNNHNFRN